MCDIQLLSTLHYFFYLAWSAKATTINPVNAVKKDSTEKGILSKSLKKYPFTEAVSRRCSVKWCS